MSVEKYFWSLNPKAIRETEKIIRDPDHPRHPEKMFVILSRCDKPRELFSMIGKEGFIKGWPRIRRYWIRCRQAEDFRAWWETVYEELTKRAGQKSRPPEIFRRIGKIVANKRIENGLSQKDLADRTRLKQPDISRIEQGKTNITLDTLIRICRVLDIKDVSLG